MLFKSIAAAALIGLAGTAASALPYNVPVATTGAAVHGDKMLAALAKVPLGEFTNNEMIRIAAARHSDDASTLAYYLSHANRLTQAPATFPAAEARENPMTADDPNAN